jgi:hypothetical protein
MKHLLLEKQLSFYREHGFVEFDNFLTDEEIYLLETEVKGSLTKKIGSLNKASSETLYLKGKDLYLTNEKLKAFCLKKKLTALLKSFSNEPLLRLAFDQALFFNENYAPPFPLVESLENIFSYQGLVNAIVFQLADHETEEETASLKPEKKGNLIFIDAQKQIDISPLFAENTEMYLIGYAKLKSQYVFNPIDPHTHELKKRGLSFGDFLTEEIHPSC